MRDVLQAPESKDTGDKFSARRWFGNQYDERKAPMMRILQTACRKMLPRTGPFDDG
jgi:hypothetical protein